MVEFFAKVSWHSVLANGPARQLSYANERSDMVRLAKAAGFVESDVPVKDVMFGVAPSSLRCEVDEDVSSLHDLVIFRKVDPENPFDLF